MAQGRGGGPGGSAQAQPGNGQALRRALMYLRAYRSDTVGALAALIFVSGANLVAPQLIRRAIDVGIAQRQLNQIVLAVVGLIAAALVRGAFTFAQSFLAERASQRVAYDLRNQMYVQVERLSFSYYDRIQTGQLLTRLTNDVEQIRTFVGTGVIQLVAAVVMLIGSATILFIINWQLAIVALLIIPAIFALVFGFVRRIGPLFGQIQQTLGQLNTVLQEDLGGVRTIRAFAREDYETSRYGSVNDTLLNTNIQVMRAFSNNFPFVGLLSNIGTLAVIWYGGWETIGGRLTVGELIAFNSYLSFLLFPVLTIGFQSAAIARAGASALRVFEILDAPREVQDKPGATPLPPITGQVEFRDVHFRYQGSDREVLRGVSFQIQPGQTVAVLGTTGAGKSTIINLLPRFYDVTGGSVRIDGHDVRDVQLGSLRSQIGIVLQETLLFSGTVRDNIAYGKPDASPTEIEAAARAAQADTFIRALSQGYDTVVGERGVGLSGGQRQRIALARALVIDPKLLILDDSTSAVDASTEAAIKSALDQLMRDKHRTAVVIAQRVSTVRDADMILVLDQGQIVAQGTHDELVHTSELYNEILGSQLQHDDALAAAA